MKRETEIVEYKKSLTQLKKGLISIAAILNKHRKGKIIFGIRDSGEVVGVDIGKDTLRDISKAISEHIEPKIYPVIKEKRIKGKDCVIIEFEGDLVPYFAYGRAYKRVSDEDRPASKAELEEMILSNNKNRLQWDKETGKEFSLKDISDKKLKEYVSDCGLEYTNKEEVLKKLGLVKNNRLTNASILLFGKDVSRYFRSLNLRCAVFLGVDKGSKILDMSDFDGDLFALISYAEKYILQHINVGMRIEGLYRVDLPEINQDAFREAIINAFCHRDYSIPQEVQIAIFKDRVEILNPGRLYGGLTIKDILTKQISERRNPLIADIFHKVHLVEKWGSGIDKIRKYEPETKFEEVGNFFMVTFKRKLAVESKAGIEKSKITKDELKSKNIPKKVLIDWLGKGWEKVGKRLGINQLKIMIILSTDSNKSIDDLATELGLSTTAIENNIKKLKDANLLRRVGGRKEGHWEVLK